MTQALQFPTNQPGIPASRLAALYPYGYSPYLNGDTTFVMTFQFETSQPADQAVLFPDVYTGWRPFTAPERVVIYNALTAFSNVANLQFQEVHNNPDADISIGIVKDSSDGEGNARGGAWRNWQWDGYAVFRSTSTTSSTLTEHSESNAAWAWRGKSLAVHELGHAIGAFLHPGPYNYGGSPSGGPYLPAREDNQKYSIMSYNANPDGLNRPDMLMLYDVAALQSVFGANTHFHAGSDRYGVPSIGTLHLIWDAGGNDRIDASILHKNVTIDLRAAHFSSLAEKDDLVIAYNVIIEDATGGSGKDTITGNGFANVLRGGGGDDMLIGGNGNDTLIGGTGHDSLQGGAGNDTYIVDTFDTIVSNVADLGFDTVRTPYNYVLGKGQEALTLSGTDSISGTGNTSNNVIVGNGAANRLIGLGGDDVIFGFGGADILDGGYGSDSLHGGAGNDVLRGGAGMDKFFFDTDLTHAGIDKISDYKSTDDSIVLDRQIFSALTATGVLAADVFADGVVAPTPDTHVLFDHAGGNLFYDADGSGVGEAILFARLTPGILLDSGEFTVV